MGERWEDIETFLLQEAEWDIRQGDPVRPCMVAFRGDQPLFCGFARPQRGDEETWSGPVFELTVLAAGMGADRVAISFSGRVTSSADPIPPVTDGVDLRQRAVVIEVVDGHHRATSGTSILYPFDGGDVDRDGRHELGESDGWITQLLVTAVASRHRLVASKEDLREQAALCIARGHLIGFDPYAVERFGLEPGEILSGRG